MRRWWGLFKRGIILNFLHVLFLTATSPPAHNQFPHSHLAYSIWALVHNYITIIVVVLNLLQIPSILDLPNADIGATTERGGCFRRQCSVSDTLERNRHFSFTGPIKTDG